MIGVEFPVISLLLVSTLTGLVVEAVKKLLNEHNRPYQANTLAGIVAAILSLASSICYTVITGTAITPPVIVYMLVMVFLSWLCSMVGYDKVMQTISQFKMDGKDE